MLQTSTVAEKLLSTEQLDDWDEEVWQAIIFRIYSIFFAIIIFDINSIALPSY